MQGIEPNSETFKIKMQESQLVIEQLIWLTNLSAYILNTTKSMMFSKDNYFLTIVRNLEALL